MSRLNTVALTQQKGKYLSEIQANLLLMKYGLRPVGTHIYLAIRTLTNE